MEKNLSMEGQSRSVLREMWRRMVVMLSCDKSSQNKPGSFKNSNFEIMQTEVSLQQKLEKKELELNSLLEITQAINSNVAEDSLYKIFNFTLRSNLNIKKLALFVLDDRWNCKVNFGTTNNFMRERLDDRFELIKNIHRLNEFDGHCSFHEFDMVIPISHKTETLALVFVGGLEQNSTHDQEEGVKFIQALSNIIIVAIENKKLARQQLQQEAFRKELEIASDVQQFLFPDKLPYTEVLKLEASYLPHDMLSLIHI